MSDQDMPRLWGLGVVAIILRWLEELLSLLNGPLLMFGAGIAVVDVLTDGALTIAVPSLLFAWAISQALGIETFLLGCFARAREAVRAGRWWTMAGWVLLGAILAFFAWQAGYVYAVMQAEHISEAAALAQVHTSAAVWLGERVALAVFLVALSGWTRYHPPAKDAAAEAQSEKDRLGREIELEPLRQQARAQKALGAVGLVRRTIAAARGKVAPETTPPTGPGTPLPAPMSRSLPDGDGWQSPWEMVPGFINPYASRQDTSAPAVSERVERGKYTSGELREMLAYRLMDENPHMSRNALMGALRAAGMGCRDETLRGIMARWAENRRNTPLPLPTRGDANEPEEPQAAAI